MANLLAYTSQNPELAKKQELEKEKLKAKAEQAKNEVQQVMPVKKSKSNSKKVKLDSGIAEKIKKLEEKKNNLLAQKEDIDAQIKAIDLEIEKLKNKKFIEVEPLITPEHGIYQYIGLLLQDKTTGENIIFAEDEYEGHEPTEHYTEEIMKELIASKKLNYRVRKSQEAQKDRTKKKAEVFTPSWICKQMIDMCEPPTDWQELVNSTWLEITCGEAPFLVNLYDATTGELVSINDRIGILDKKLQAINKNIVAENYVNEKAYKRDWIDWVYKAYKSTYGYEWQGDNLFIARLNLLQTFFEYFKDKWGYDIMNKETIQNIIKIITWNIWQMDGLKDVIPLTDIPAKIRDWETDTIIEFQSLKPVKQVVKQTSKKIK